MRYTATEAVEIVQEKVVLTSESGEREAVTVTE
jgi:hypothetical protein